MTESSGAADRLWCERAVLSGGAASGVLLEVANGRFVTVSPASDPVEGVERLEGWVVPGFVDTHVHGGGGHDYATTDPDEALAARAFHRRHGTTTSFASLVTAGLDTLVAQLGTLAPLVHRGELAGVHLEGPFLSPARKGAHDETLLRTPTPELVDRLLAAADGTLRMVTLAPELPGALDATARLVAAGVAVAVGHTDGDETDARRALDAGASVATHLFNAMRPVHQREPGPVPVLLDDERVMVELIGDGFHLHPDIVRLAVAAAGLEGTALVTDAMVATGMPDGAYSLGGLDVVVRRGEARLVEDDGAPGSIAGSTLTMAAGFEFLRRTGLSVPGAAWLAASTPARRHELDGVGVIEPGGQADLCVVDDAGRLQRVLQRGGWVTR
ncbi:N-acetylglucosamine-6-phosphate deacetylase [uncultured Friedmanniella sp.]|uniref:N-acetylglucosamine-6-phosphate deacetylase n=1 Tax=uncultured Friedmanniella sp. TaxID=335381 RepID=UPI0035CC9614